MGDYYPVDIDIDPEQVVRWLLVERQRGGQGGGSGLRVEAWRVNVARPLPVRAEDRLGDEEREDLSDEATVARLEISPTHGGEGWRIVISAEEELEESGDEDDPGEEQEPIDLDAFYQDFILPGRATISIGAEAEGPEAEAHLAWLLRAVETNAHVPEIRPFEVGKAP